MDEEHSPALPDVQKMRRTLFWFALSWAAIVVIGGLLSAHYRIEGYRRNEMAGANARLQSLQDNIENHFRSLAALAQVLVRQPSYADYLRQGLAPEPALGRGMAPALLRDKLIARPDVRQMNAQLDAIVRNFQIRQVYLQNAYGTSVADSSDQDARYSTIGHNFRERAYFREAMESGAGFQFVMGRVSHKAGFNFSARVDDGSRALGVLILKTDPASMQRLFTDTTGRILSVVDVNGVVIASNNAEQVLKQMPNSPSLAGREREMEGAYLTVPRRLNWRPTTVEVMGHGAPAVDIGRDRYLHIARAIEGYPYTASVLAPLSGEATIEATTALGTFALLVLGWLVIWSYFRRIQRQNAIEQVRTETLEMTRALPLTLFRYRVSPNGNGRFTYIGTGVNALFGVDEHVLIEQPARLWGAGDATPSCPPTKPTEFAIDLGAQKRWISVNSAVASTPDGGKIYDGYWLDVTARRLAENRFEAVFTHAASGFMFFHRRKGILRCNPATLRLFGAHDMSQLHGLRPWDPPLSLPSQPNGEASSKLAEQLLDNSREGGLSNRFEWRLRRLDGALFDAEVMLLWLGHEDEHLYFAIVDDISARKQTEEALRTASQAAQETTRAKSAFLANMSHEIRTPMNAIIGMTHLALDNAPPDKIRQYIAKANQAANNLLQIINDVLDMSKIEAGHLELECIDFSLQDVLDQVADVLGLPAERKGLELLFNAPPDLPSRLMGDPTRLRQILVNLGSNGVKFTDRGSVTIGLEVQHRHDHDILLHGWVRDTGMGMSPEQQAKLFKPFSQVDVSTTRRFGGTGLGLTISAQLAERLGGRLWVDSALNEGSTFHFTVRMGLPERHTPMALLSEDWKDKRALLVDDNADARQVLSQMTSKLGLMVDVASSGEEALQHLRQAQRPYDWILLDWKMPGMDGVTCARHVRELAQQRFPDANPCILLVTAFSRTDALKAAADTPLADVLTKPVTPSTLFDSLTRALTHAAELQVVSVADHRVAPFKPQAVASLEGVSILLVEDQPLNQELAKELLTRAGAEITIAEDGSQALDELAAAPERFDCVLMDCQMPRMDGYTATRRIRSDGRWHHLPIIAMTASALVSDREAALASGMNDHVPKPLDVNQMFQVISRWVKVSRGAKIAR